MARELSTDPYVPLVGTLPPDAGPQEALAWVERQRARHGEDAGFSFTVAVAATGVAVGHCGLWLRQPADGRATAGYAIVPSARRKGYGADALAALTRFAWTLPGLTHVALDIEPWNTGSVRVAELAGYRCDGLLLGHREIAGERRDMLRYVAERPRPGDPVVTPASPAPRGTPRRAAPGRAG